MSDVMRFRLGELLGIEPPCAFLSDDEMQAFIERRLAPERQQRFERHMNDCEACAELRNDTVVFENLVSAGLQVPAERHAFQESDPGLRRRLGIGRGRKRGWTWMYWLVPAVGALALVAVVLSLGPDPRMFGPVESMPLVAPPSVRGLTLAEIYDRLEPVWLADDMAAAVEILKPGVAANPQQEDLIFYLGVAQLRSGDAAAAITTLRRVDALQAEIPSEHTRWYLAAALDATGDATQACEMLAAVVQIDGRRAATAAQLAEAHCR